MRLLAILLGLSMPLAAHAQEAGGISPSLSRCAGKAGGSLREGDPAFVTIALDGEPWITIERTEATVGTQPIATTLTGTGWQRRRDGTSAHFRFTCVLDDRGQAVLFHPSSLLRELGDRLPPAIVVDGNASIARNARLPRGAELQVQLLDRSQPPGTMVLAEQVVRSGWHVPIAFALRLPKDAVRGDRLEMTARIVHAHQTLFELKEPRTLDEKDLQTFIALTLTEAKPSGR